MTAGLERVMPNKAEHIFEVNEATFNQDVLSKSRELPVIVDFWAAWCGPCRALSPILEKLAIEGKGAFLLAKVNVDDNPNLATRYGVQGLPAVKAFREGRILAEFIGAQPESKVRDFLRSVAPTEADRALAEAHSLLTTRHWAKAEAAFRKAHTAQPDNAPATLGLMKAMLAQGRGCEAQELIEDFPRSDLIVQAEKLTALASLLCEVESSDAPIDEHELDAAYHQAARLLARGNLEAGMDGLLDVLRQNKKYRKGEPRLVMLGIFELLGEDDPTTRTYRNELASALF